MDEIFAALLLADKTPATFAERVVGLVVLVVSLASLIALIIYFAQRQRRGDVERWERHIALYEEQSRKSDEYAAEYRLHQQRMEKLLTRIADALERSPHSK